jgi:hypothetical protein
MRCKPPIRRFVSLLRSVSSLICVSVSNRTSLRTGETEIEKSRAETGARKPGPKDETARNCRPETEARRPNPRYDMALARLIVQLISNRALTPVRQRLLRRAPTRMPTMRASQRESSPGCHWRAML